MKHDLPLGAAQPMMAAPEAPLALALHLIEAVDAQGKPGLAGCTDAAVLCPTRFTEDAIGDFAVCTPVNTGTLLVLGRLPVAAMSAALIDPGLSRATPARPITLKCGRSQLQLHPDGRIRITGDDIVVESNGRAALRGAVIDLN